MELESICLEEGVLLGKYLQMQALQIIELQRWLVGAALTKRALSQQKGSNIQRNTFILMLFIYDWLLLLDSGTASEKIQRS